MEYDSNKNQEIKRRFVSREVIACASTLVHELSQKAEHFPDYEEDLYTAYEGLPDYEEAARNEGWDGQDNEECSVFYNEESGDTSYAESWEELCGEQNIDVYEYCSDILEHWIVTDYLADKLEAHGERVLRDFFGFTIWCRSTSGQAILLDHVISVICEEMGILEGQAYEWDV